MLLSNAAKLPALWPELALRFILLAGVNGRKGLGLLCGIAARRAASLRVSSAAAASLSAAAADCFASSTISLKLAATFAGKKLGGTPEP
jgi:hypothetical protein